MTLTKEQQQTLALFPDALRQLVLDELACGNSIEEIGHSFPAPPAGAYIKLANVVSTRPRESDSVLSFRARNSAISSGEFTDDVRFYFVVEPPSAPEPEPDMDAIRREQQSREDALMAALVARAPHVPSVESDNETDKENHNETAAAEAIAPTTAREIVAAHPPSAVEYSLHFYDTRPPHEVQFALERTVRVLFSKEIVHDQLCMRAKARVNGASYVFTLSFVAAMLNTNSYSLHVDCSWPQRRPEDDEHFRRTSRSWLEFWTKDLGASAAQREGEGSAERYRVLAEAAMQAEAHLDSVAALKQAVVSGLKQGGTYSQSHKEGGTDIAWRGGAFMRSDYGDNPGYEKYTDEALFLQALRNFCNWDITMHAATDTVSDVDAWRMILRRMEAARGV